MATPVKPSNSADRVEAAQNVDIEAISTVVGQRDTLKELDDGDGLISSTEVDPNADGYFDAPPDLNGRELIQLQNQLFRVGLIHRLSLPTPLITAPDLTFASLEITVAYGKPHVLAVFDGQEDATRFAKENGLPHGIFTPRNGQDGWARAIEGRHRARMVKMDGLQNVDPGFDIVVDVGRDQDAKEAIDRERDAQDILFQDPAKAQNVENLPRYGTKGPYFILDITQTLNLRQGVLIELFLEAKNDKEQSFRVCHNLTLETLGFENADTVYGNEDFLPQINSLVAQGKLREIYSTDQAKGAPFDLTQARPGDIFYLYQNQNTGGATEVIHSAVYLGGGWVYTKNGARDDRLQRLDENLYMYDQIQDATFHQRSAQDREAQQAYRRLEKRGVRTGDEALPYQPIKMRWYREG